jgi:hypothetical protein
MKNVLEIISVNPPEKRFAFDGSVIYRNSCEAVVYSKEGVLDVGVLTVPDGMPLPTVGHYVATYDVGTDYDRRIGGVLKELKRYDSLSAALSEPTDGVSSVKVRVLKVSEPKQGRSKGKSYSITEALCVLLAADGTLQTGSLVLPRGVEGVAPGEYLARFEVGVSWKRRAVTPLLVSLEPVGKPVARAPAPAAVRPAVTA